MKQIQFFIFSILLLLASCSPFNRAEKKYDKGEYNEAIDFYKKAIEKDKMTAYSYFQIGESYRLSNRADEAAEYYKKAIDKGIPNRSVHLYYGMALKSQGKYKEAEKHLDQYIREGEDEDLLALGERVKTNIRFVEELLQKESWFEINNLGYINTEASEYSPMVHDGYLYFTSSRSNSNRVYKATGENFTNIYRAALQGVDIVPGSIEELPEEIINNPNINEGSVTFSPDGSLMVFARGNSGRRKGTRDVNLYQSRYRNGQWGEPELLPINDPNAWDSCPAFSPDGKTLYFASNREGGFGGTDIYTATLDGAGRWGNVRNLGSPINTPGLEMFPYISDDRKLYFSSNGHPGIGGLDLFVATRRRGQTYIENLGTPINSVKDDFSIVYLSPNQGFMSSNRDNGMGSDDIYYFKDNSPALKVVKYFLTGITNTPTEGQEVIYDSLKTKEILPDTRVRLLDAGGKQIAETRTAKQGNFRFEVEGGRNYILVGEKDGYFTTRKEFSTIGKSIPQDELEQDTTIIDFKTELTLDKLELEKSFVLENIYYDFDKADIREDAAIELDKLVLLLDDNPTIRIELSSHTDSRGDDNYNMNLSQRRAESAVRYIVSRGVKNSRLVAKGYGESKHIIENAQTEEEHQINRRTEFKVIELLDENAIRQEELQQKSLEERIQWDN
ncbi:MAG: OmpA family protein [Cyclobacteriaceae bacterium]|nr:PD40 domain-containing protein [Cyclobacteriaceae bacterium]MCH8515661.1 OmpA family protein [Cyclobacteriaceae bacterium]